ncbi:MAG: DUF1501 domain-containing protein, partial [Pirellulaceae bacterium]|nr:DUF1501 domain-containing protein [Pirellulaceae bacterium]
MLDGHHTQMPRRHFFAANGSALGAAALASLAAAESPDEASAVPKHGGLHFAPRAKRVIYLFQAGGPAQMELYDHKPELKKRHGQELPPSVLTSQRLTGFTAGQKKFPIVASPFKFSRQGECGAWVSELNPHLGTVVDDLCFIKSVHTEAVNHDPAVTHMLTGAQQAGRPSMGAWLSYGIGSENHDLPAFVVLLTPGLIQDASTPLSARHWGSGFLPSRHQGVKFRAGKDPVLYLSNAPGIDRGTRRQMLDVAAQLNRRQFQVTGDPETEARIAQYELAYRMQTSVPQLTDLSNEPQHVFDAYGPLSKTPGTYAANCLLARRLVESGVRFVQVFDRDWDHHRNAPQHLKTKGQTSDQPTAALIRDLKQRGLLDDTLVVCGGEFGRTVYCQGPIQEKYGRDHHGGCFTVWMAGGGVRGGQTFGGTDEFSYCIVDSPVHVHDVHATILHC